MKKVLLSLVLFHTLLIANAQQMWQSVTASEAASSGVKDRTSFPKTQYYYKLDLNALKLALQHAPMRGQNSNLILPFPDANGKMQHFRIYEAPVMHPDLAVRFPNNKSYVGQGIENRSSVIRFSVTLFGLHAMTLTANNGTSYIDPYSKDSHYYVSYLREGLTTNHTFECHTADTQHSLPIEDIQAQPQDNGVYRTYRTGIVTTVEYSQFHIEEAGLEFGTLEEKKAAVLAAVAVTVTRVNSMFERDLSVFLQLIPNEDEVIYIDTDDLTNDDVGALINETQQTLDEVIGTENYDFGHGVGTSGGGLGGGQPCAEGGKAFGATGLGSPVGDPFDIDYVAHEMGHQFGAAHTFNNECGGNRDSNWSYEPGSGSSIMAYAGICDPNIQSNSDAQFFAGSIAQIRNTINGNGGNCATTTNNNNTPPVISAGIDYTIPKGTAFILTGTATDSDNDALTYTWEQYDKEITTQPPLASATEGPNFKPQVITDVPVRYLPRLADVLNNNLAPTWEVISNVGREYNFAFTVRDNNINGGESVTDFMKVNVSNTAGPFAVVSPNNNLSWPVASNQNVMWNVAGTTENGVNTPYVDILLSTNGGLNFNTVLAENVPNDGSEFISVPNTPGTANRIMVRGHGNIFYDVSNQNFTIAAAAEPTFIVDSNGDQNISICKGSNAVFTFDYSTINGFSGITNFSVMGLPPNVTAQFSPNPANSNGIVQMTVENTLNAPAGFYTLVFTAVSGSINKVVTVYLDLLDTNFSAVALNAPANLAVGVGMNPTLTWDADPIASGYDVEMATDVAFTSLILSAETTTNSYTTAVLEQSTTYYWRVKPKNAGCSGNFGSVSQFTTGQLVCEHYDSENVPVAIPSDGVATVSSTIQITDSFAIEQAAVTLNISHTWVTDIAVKLISPAGTEINLFSNQCGDNDDIDAFFTDSGEPLNCSGTPVISGMVMPETPLSTLMGENSSGTWTLEVFDEFAEDGGFINSWSLDLCSIQPTLSVKENDIKTDFALYPNPNNGSFTIELNQANGTDYLIGIYDLRGRKIFEKKPTVNGGILHETIMLDAEAGVYLMQLQNGESKTVKKFIIR